MQTVQINLAYIFVDTRDTLENTLHFVRISWCKIYFSREIIGDHDEITKD